MTRDDALATLETAAHLAAARGSLLFHLDLATELARAALARDGVPTDLLAPLAGPDGYQVQALEGGASVRLRARVTFDEQGQPTVARGSGRVSAQGEAIARARQTLADASPGRAIVVVPRTAGDALEGYALAIAAHPGPPILDRHVRCLLTADGRTIVSRTPMPVGRPGPDGTLRSDEAVPNELHVYLSLKHGNPTVINAEGSRLTWIVDGERIRIDPRRPKP